MQNMQYTIFYEEKFIAKFSYLDYCIFKKKKKTPNPKSINDKIDKIQLKICEAVIIFNHVRS